MFRQIWLTLLTALAVTAAHHVWAVADEPSEVFPVTSPPVELKVPSFYTKHVDADGYPIVASETVNDYALKEAAFLINLMLAKRPDVRKAMAASGSRLLIMAHDEFTTDLPEYSQMKPKDYWDARARGLGGSKTDPYCSCGEENLLCYPGDPYSTENILIHEFAHNIHLRGMVNVDPTFDDRLQQTYDQAMSQGLWRGAYASTNHHEYFAEGVQSWFNNNREPDHDHNHVNTRKELREYDPGLAKICEEVFGETELVYTKPQTRLEGHLAGYDPANAPTFEWPEHLSEAKKEIRSKAQMRGQLAEQQAAYKIEMTRIDDETIPASNHDNPEDISLLFENRSKKTFRLNWKNFDGDLQFYASLPPGRRYQQQTFSGHVWVVTDEVGMSVGYFVAPEKPATAIIGGPASEND